MTYHNQIHQTRLIQMYSCWHLHYLVFHPHFIGINPGLYRLSTNEQVIAARLTNQLKLMRSYSDIRINDHFQIAVKLIRLKHEEASKNEKRCKQDICRVNKVAEFCETAIRQ